MARKMRTSSLVPLAWILPLPRNESYRLIKKAAEGMTDPSLCYSVGLEAAVDRSSTIRALSHSYAAADGFVNDALRLLSLCVCAACRIINKGCEAFRGSRCAQSSRPFDRQQKWGKCLCWRDPTVWDGERFETRSTEVQENHLTY